MRELLQAALAGNYAVGYFEAWDQYSLEAVLEAAEECRSPVILGFGGEIMNQEWYDGGGQRRLAALGVAAVESAKVPTALLLNEAKTIEQVSRGLAWGFNAVMLDTSGLPFAENVAAIRRVVEMAHAVGACVEGEVTRLADASGTLGAPAPHSFSDGGPAPHSFSDGAPAPHSFSDGAPAPHSFSDGGLTDPAQAARYVAETGVDALSVSIGNVHVLTEGESRIDLDHLARLHSAVRVPLVIHGGTGFPDSAVAPAIALGVAKFNVGTILKQVFLEGLRDALAALPARVNLLEAVGSRKANDVQQRAKERMKAEVMRRMAVYRSAGKA
jgi:fructose-bisphosphate aldolase class II